MSLPTIIQAYHSSLLLLACMHKFYSSHGCNKLFLDRGLCIKVQNICKAYFLYVGLGVAMPHWKF